MFILDSNLETGLITISDSYNISLTQSSPDSTPEFLEISSEIVLSFIKIEKVINFSKLNFNTIGTTKTRFLTPYFRISRNGNSWTDFYELKYIDEEDSITSVEGINYNIKKSFYEISEFPPFDPLDLMWIEIKWIRLGSKTDGSIRLTGYELIGDLKRNEVDETIILKPNTEFIIKPPYTYKVFKITDIELIGSNSNINIQWRFSQDNKRTWSTWEPLTKENISTKRINPVRFFNIEYLIKNETGSDVKISDINLIGDFQNVTLDSQKTNLYGIRECCQSYLLAGAAGGSNAGTVDENGVFIPNTSGNLSGQACSTDNQFKPLTDEEKSTLYNPYQQTAAVNLLNKLSNDGMEIFGHKVQYFVTDPDGKGIDYSLHEYGLFNIVCESYIKVAVDGNQFPDNQIIMNQFDLNLFDSFEIHITKEGFKTAFGVQRRPSKEDLVWFCDINRLYIVDHAQPFRNFNNYAVYYKVVLRKYNKAANVQADNSSIQDRIKQLTNNSTIDELFGLENNQDKLSIANKTQLQPLSRDPIRLSISGVITNRLIVKELIENSSTIISKQHYDLSEAFVGGTNNTPTSVIKYKNIPNTLLVSDNIGFTVWFRINNYLPGESYNLWTQYDDNNQLGWKVNIIDDKIILNINTYQYEFDLSPLNEDVWYCYVLNLNQRIRNISHWLYKRDLDIDEEDKGRFLSTTILKKVDYKSEDLIPVEYELESIDSEILVSDIRLTNVRLFSDIIPESQHNKILNQYVIANDSKYLIFADNANMKLILPVFKDNSSSFE